MDYTIRPAQKSDASAMYRISVRAHTQTYYEAIITAESMREFIEYYRFSARRQERFMTIMNRKMSDDKWSLSVAESHNEVIGYTLGYREDEHTLQLKGLFVDPMYHRHGVGSALFRASLAFAPGATIIRLSVLEANKVAKRMYEKNGFVDIGRDEKAFFGAEQIIMERKQ